MSAATVKKQADILISQFLKAYSDIYGERPRDFNRYSLRWGFIDMIEDLGFTDAEKTLAYYMSLKRAGHPARRFLSQYGELNRIRVDKEKDAEERRRLMAESKRRVEEMNGKQ